LILDGFGMKRAQRVRERWREQENERKKIFKKIERNRKYDRIIININCSKLSNMKTYCSSCNKKCYFTVFVGGTKLLYLTKKLSYSICWR
jgi:hypothetical protein